MFELPFAYYCGSFGFESLGIDQLDRTMLERMRGTPAVVVGLHTTIKILCRTYIEAVVGAAKDIDIVHWVG